MSSFFKYINTKFHTPSWLFVLLLAVLLFRIPTFFEPYAYGDEMIYLALGEAVRQGIPLYKGIHDNKPPLLYLTAAVAGSLFWFRAILAIWHLVTIYLFWKLADHLFPKNEKLQIIATCIFSLLTTIPLLEGNIANAEIFMIGPTIYAFYLLLSKQLNFTKIFFSGLLFSLSTLYKVPAAFDIPAIIFYWIAYAKFTSKEIFNVSKRTIVLTVGFILPILLTFVWYYFEGALKEYFIAAFGQNVGYLSSFRPDDKKEPFLVKNGPLLIRAGVVALGMLVLYLKRTKISKNFLFLTAWLLLTIFAVTLSERPYPHYLLQSIPPLSLLLAMLFTLNSIEQTLAIIPLTLFFVAPVYYRFWYYPSAPYYIRYAKFISGQISREQYRASFGGNVNVDYEIANYLSKNTTKEDKIFVWGDNGAIYALTRKLPPIKYVADYHISDFSSQSEVVKELETRLPSYIVILTPDQRFPELYELLKMNYVLVENFEQATVWKLLNPKVKKLITP